MTLVLLMLVCLAPQKKVVAKKPIPIPAKKTVASAKPAPKLTAKNAAPVKKPTLPPHPTIEAKAMQTALAAAGSAEPVTASGLTSAMVEAVAAGKGRIDYDKGVTRAIGLGALPPPTLARSRAQDTLDARDAALNDALRTLAMAVQQVRVTATSRVSNYTLQSDEVRVKLAGVVKNAEVVEEKLLPEAGIYRVIVQVPLTGSGSVAEALTASKVAKELVEPKKEDPYAPGAPAPKDATYTGLIIDCRGYGLARSLAPKLCDTDGDEVYGTMTVSAEFLNEFGIVAYPRTLEDARLCPRIGDRPLIIRATGVLDGERTRPSISKSDARKILDANSRDHFLERCAVVFVTSR